MRRNAKVSEGTGCHCSQINAPDGADIAKIVHSTGGGLRRVYTESKIKEDASMKLKEPTAPVRC